MLTLRPLRVFSLRPLRLKEAPERLSKTSQQIYYL
jgi:hypothetical protein